MDKNDLVKFRSECLSAHNFYRSLHSTTPLVWSNKLADGAQKWAEELASADSLSYSHERGVGENIACLWGSDVTGNKVTQIWYEEAKHYDFTAPRVTPITRPFCQVIWKGTRELGAGKSTTKNGKQIVVARYNPPATRRNAERNVNGLKLDRVDGDTSLVPRSLGLRKFQEECLFAHNEFRVLHGSPPLHWSPSLAWAAQQWAEELVRMGVLKHNDDEMVGENLAGMVGDELTGKECTDMWYDEVAEYDFDNPGYSEDTSNFTQVVWIGSELFGVGRATYGDLCVVVAFYEPPGNMEGMFTDNVCKAGTRVKTYRLVKETKTFIPPSPGLDWFRVECLVAHNYFRARHGATPLVIAHGLNEEAQYWAERLLVTGATEDLQDSRIGINVAVIEGEQHVSGLKVTELWYEESTSYNFESPGFNLQTRSFTQLLWLTSRKLGVGKAANENGQCVVVARYEPVGNIDGLFVSNVRRRGHERNAIEPVLFERDVKYRIKVEGRRSLRMSWEVEGAMLQADNTQHDKTRLVWIESPVLPRRRMRPESSDLEKDDEDKSDEDKESGVEDGEEFDNEATERVPEDGRVLSRVAYFEQFEKMADQPKRSSAELKGGLKKTEEHEETVCQLEYDDVFPKHDEHDERDDDFASDEEAEEDDDDGMSLETVSEADEDLLGELEEYDMDHHIKSYCYQDNYLREKSDNDKVERASSDNENIENRELSLDNCVAVAVKREETVNEQLKHADHNFELIPRDYENQRKNIDLDKIDLTDTESEKEIFKFETQTDKTVKPSGPVCTEEVHQSSRESSRESLDLDEKFSRLNEVDKPKPKPPPTLPKPQRNKQETKTVETKTYSETVETVPVRLEKESYFEHREEPQRDSQVKISSEKRESQNEVQQNESTEIEEQKYSTTLEQREVPMEPELKESSDEGENTDSEAMEVIDISHIDRDRRVHKMLNRLGRHIELIQLEAPKKGEFSKDIDLSETSDERALFDFYTPPVKKSWSTRPVQEDIIYAQEKQRVESEIPWDELFNDSEESAEKETEDEIPESIERHSFKDEKRRSVSFKETVIIQEHESFREEPLQQEDEEYEYCEEESEEDLKTSGEEYDEDIEAKVEDVQELSAGQPVFLSHEVEVDTEIVDDVRDGEEDHFETFEEEDASMVKSPTEDCAQTLNLSEELSEEEEEGDVHEHKDEDSIAEVCEKNETPHYPESSHEVAIPSSCHVTAEIEMKETEARPVEEVNTVLSDDEPEVIDNVVVRGTPEISESTVCVTTETTYHQKMEIIHKRAPSIEVDALNEEEDIQSELARSKDILPNGHCTPSYITCDAKDVTPEEPAESEKETPDEHEDSEDLPEEEHVEDEVVIVSRPTHVSSSPNDVDNECIDKQPEDVVEETVQTDEGEDVSTIDLSPPKSSMEREETTEIQHLEDEFENVEDLQEEQVSIRTEEKTEASFVVIKKEERHFNEQTDDIPIKQSEEVEGVAEVEIENTEKPYDIPEYEAVEDEQIEGKELEIVEGSPEIMQIESNEELNEEVSEHEGEFPQIDDIDVESPEYLEEQADLKTCEEELQKESSVEESIEPDIEPIVEKKEEAVELEDGGIMSKSITREETSIVEEDEGTDHDSTVVKKTITKTMITTTTSRTQFTSDEPLVLTEGDTVLVEHKSENVQESPQYEDEIAEEIVEKEREPPTEVIEELEESSEEMQQSQPILNQEAVEVEEHEPQIEEVESSSESEHVEDDEVKQVHEQEPQTNDVEETFESEDKPLIQTELETVQLEDGANVSKCVTREESSTTEKDDNDPSGTVSKETMTRKIITTTTTTTHSTSEGQMALTEGDDKEIVFKNADETEQISESEELEDQGSQPGYPEKIQVQEETVVETMQVQVEPEPKTPHIDDVETPQKITTRHIVIETYEQIKCRNVEVGRSDDFMFIPYEEEQTANLKEPIDTPEIKEVEEPAEDKSKEKDFSDDDETDRDESAVPTEKQPEEDSDNLLQPKLSDDRFGYISEEELEETEELYITLRESSEEQEYEDKDVYIHQDAPTVIHIESQDEEQLEDDIAYDSEVITEVEKEITSALVVKASFSSPIYDDENEKVVSKDAEQDEDVKDPLVQFVEVEKGEVSFQEEEELEDSPDVMEESEDVDSSDENVTEKVQLIQFTEDTEGEKEDLHYELSKDELSEPSPSRSFEETEEDDDEEEQLESSGELTEQSVELIQFSEKEDETKVMDVSEEHFVRPPSPAPSDEFEKELDSSEENVEDGVELVQFSEQCAEDDVHEEQKEAESSEETVEESVEMIQFSETSQEEKIIEFDDDPKEVLQYVDESEFSEEKRVHLVEFSENDLHVPDKQENTDTEDSKEFVSSPTYVVLEDRNNESENSKEEEVLIHLSEERVEVEEQVAKEERSIAPCIPILLPDSTDTEQEEDELSTLKDEKDVDFITINDAPLACSTPIDVTNNKSDDTFDDSGEAGFGEDYDVIEKIIAHNESDDLLQSSEASHDATFHHQEADEIATKAVGESDGLDDSIQSPRQVVQETVTETEDEKAELIDLSCLEDNKDHDGVSSSCEDHVSPPPAIFATEFVAEEEEEGSDEEYIPHFDHPRIYMVEEKELVIDPSASETQSTDLVDSSVKMEGTLKDTEDPSEISAASEVSEAIEHDPSQHEVTTHSTNMIHNQVNNLDELEEEDQERIQKRHEKMEEVLLMDEIDVQRSEPDAEKPPVTESRHEEINTQVTYTTAISSVVMQKEDHDVHSYREEQATIKMQEDERKLEEKQSREENIAADEAMTEDDFRSDGNSSKADESFEELEEDNEDGRQVTGDYQEELEVSKLEPLYKEELSESQESGPINVGIVLTEEVEVERVLDAQEAPESFEDDDKTVEGEEQAEGVYQEEIEIQKVDDRDGDVFEEEVEIKRVVDHQEHETHDTQKDTTVAVYEEELEVAADITQDESNSRGNERIVLAEPIKDSTEEDEEDVVLAEPVQHEGEESDSLESEQRQLEEYEVDEEDQAIPHEIEGLDEFQRDCIRQHNIYRHQHRACRLVWSEDLSNAAKSWAEHLAAANILEHSPDKEHGENLASAKGYDLRGDKVAEMWYDEVKDYNFETPAFNAKCGHFTQMIWRDTKEFGVAKSTADDGTQYVVARYFPPGNILGEFKTSIRRARGQRSSVRKRRRSSTRRRTSQTDSGDTITQQEKFKNECVVSHNYYRSLHGAQPLQWSTRLAIESQNFAEKLVRSGSFMHSGDKEIGECLAFSFGLELSGRDAVDSWYDEIVDYDYEFPGYTSHTANFTQVVWQGTKEFGMGKAIGEDGSCVVVGRYFPPGNHVGEFQDNVKQKQPGYF